jgi:hypothetical protein
MDLMAGRTGLSLFFTVCKRARGEDFRDGPWQPGRGLYNLLQNLFLRQFVILSGAKNLVLPITSTLRTRSG